jgi:hypothetical protein
LNVENSFHLTHIDQFMSKKNAVISWLWIKEKAPLAGAFC